LNRGLNELVIAACCTFLDTNHKQRISDIVVFFSSDGDIHTKGILRTTYDLRTSRFDIQAGTQLGMSMIPALEALLDNEAVRFRITD